MKPATLAKLKEPQNRAEFQEKIELIVAEFTLQGESRETVKEILAGLKTKFEISPALVRKLAKAYADGKLNDLIEQNSEIVSLTQALQ